MDDLESIHAGEARYEAECQALEQAIALLDPRGIQTGLVRERWDGMIEFETHGVDLRSYPVTEIGSAEARRDLFAARATYLQSRWESLRDRRERQLAAQQRIEQGIARFAPGDISLDEIVATTADTTEALAELRAERTERSRVALEEEKRRVAAEIAERARR